mmetsp:Transcript_36149/g.56458  ORF Transcript_36149/g.56458 Transcript_36149/m.56458 type:complete len:260 (+) Transcript_36149:1321-2100(+)
MGVSESDPPVKSTADPGGGSEDGLPVSDRSPLSHFSELSERLRWRSPAANLNVNDPRLNPLSGSVTGSGVATSSEPPLSARVAGFIPGNSLVSGGGRRGSNSFSFRRGDGGSVFLAEIIPRVFRKASGSLDFGVLTSCGKTRSASRKVAPADEARRKNSVEFRFRFVSCGAGCSNTTSDGIFGEIDGFKSDRGWLSPLRCATVVLTWRTSSVSFPTLVLMEFIPSRISCRMFTEPKGPLSSSLLSFDVSFCLNLGRCGW